jgi:excisionase family DNA binding protein
MNMNEDGELPKLPGYMPVKEAAKLIGLSPRRILEYVQEEKLHGYKAGKTTMISEAEVREFQRNYIGRKRMNVPVWRTPVGDNMQYITFIIARMRQGQDARLEEKIEEIRAGKKHLLPGTVARYISRSEEKPDDIQIVLIWRSTVMPPAAEREAAMQALRAELAEIVDWETAWSENGRVIMHT